MTGSGRKIARIFATALSTDSGRSVDIIAKRWLRRRFFNRSVNLDYSDGGRKGLRPFIAKCILPVEPNRYGRLHTFKHPADQDPLARQDLASL